VTSARPLSLGASRRLGLGAPLAGRPSVQRTASGAELPLTRSARAVASPDPSSELPPPRRAAAAARPLPELRVASDTGGPASAPATDAGPAGGAPVAPGVGLAATAVQRSTERPLLGDAGRLPTPGLAADDSTARGRDDASVGELPGGPDAGPGGPRAVVAGGVAGGSPGPAPSSAHATPPDRGPGAAGSGAPPLESPAPQPTGIGAPPLAHHAAAVAGTTSARAAPLVVARSLRGAEPLRAAGRAGAPPVAAAAPAPAWHGPEAASSGSTSTPTGSRLPPRPPGSPASGARGGGLPVARSTASTPAAGGSAAELLPVSRLANDAAPAAPQASNVLSWSAASGFAVSAPSDAWAPAVQRAVAIDEVTAAPAAGAASAGEGGGAGQDYEEIADRVYDRIRSRFANELLLDRERMGLLIDG
jgi:hypothetical protein